MMQRLLIEAMDLACMTRVKGESGSSFLTNDDYPPVNPTNPSIIFINTALSYDLSEG